MSINKTDIAFRFGGDEFIVLMPNTAIADAVKVAEKLRREVETGHICSDFTVTISISAVQRICQESFNHWFARLDKVLYQVKNHHRNQIGLWDQKD